MTPLFVSRLDHGLCDAPVADGKWPLVLFSHGLCSHPQTYCMICMDIASHGRIVAAVEHTDGSSVTAFVGSQRRHIPFRKYSHAADGPMHPYYRRMLGIRMDDFDAVLDALRSAARSGGVGLDCQSEEPVRESPIMVGRIDFDNLSVAGHSWVQS